MERDLRARLRAHRLSGSFVDRHAEDALQRGVVEYLRAREAGRDIREPTGLILKAAFRRAIDELRSEARSEETADIERLLEEAGDSSPSAEEAAVEDMAAAELRAAIESLPGEERQALCLHYFEELSDARSAKLLYCSERTFRRRLRKALADLGELLGAPAPEPGSHRGLEVGLAAWVSLRGARVVLSSHPAEHLSAAVDAVRHGFTQAIHRLRTPATQFAGEGAPERIGAIAGGPAGKVIGGCAGAAAICALSGVVGPGVQLGGSQSVEDGHPPVRKIAHRRRTSRRPLVVRPRTLPQGDVEPTHETAASSTAPRRPTPRHPHHTDRHPVKSSHDRTAPVEEPPSEAVQVEEQFSGVAQATAEAEAEAPASTDGDASVEEATPTRSTAPSGSSHAASEERQVEEQFRGPLAR